MQDIKTLVRSSNPSDVATCERVLESFHTACDPNSGTCSSGNQQSFQGMMNAVSSIDLNSISQLICFYNIYSVTIDQVCEAVNTKTKLNVQGENLHWIALHTLFFRLVLIAYLNDVTTIAMGDEFDGFVDENYEREFIYIYLIICYYSFSTNELCTILLKL